jgi:hypothetical protein
MFIELSGRTDLAPGTDVVPNCDFFINAGQRFLDRLLFSGRSEASYFVNLSASQMFVPVPGCRAVKDVWVYDSSSRTRLQEITSGDLLTNFTEPKASMEKGKPAYYAIVNLKAWPAAFTIGDLTQQWVADLIINGDLQAGYLTAIAIVPPVDSGSAYTLEVDGVFKSDNLTSPAAVSFWTELYPEILLKACFYELEVFNRNSEGMKDWKSAIDVDMFGLVCDYIEEEIRNIEKIGG